MRGLNIFFDVIVWCVSFVRICMGTAEVHDYIAIAFTTSFLLYEINRAVKKSRNNRDEVR